MDFVYIRMKNSHFLTTFREKGHGSRKFGIKPLKKVPILQKMRNQTYGIRLRRRRSPFIIQLGYTVVGVSAKSDE